MSTTTGPLSKVPFLAKRERHPVAKPKPLCTLASPTSDILASAKTMFEASVQYRQILDSRREDTKKERDAVEEELDAVQGEQSAEENVIQANEKTLADLHTKLRTQLGDEANEKLMQSRPSLSKVRPTLPVTMKNVKGGAVHKYIQHGAGPEEAEGSRAPAARAAPKRDKILGGGGHNDKIPEASEIGSGIAFVRRPRSSRLPYPTRPGVLNGLDRSEKFGGEGDEGGHVRYGLKGTKRGAETAGGRLTRGRDTRKAQRTWPRQW
ncbi:hypothetical protein FB451DRAFT_1175841 [Mycena latifolia]|nr:hypothetical protein FB451DRAFT_1175841 [Mycena latifolia]